MPGHFDAVLDFDRVVADPSNTARLLPKYDSGDHIHPNAMAYHAMADSIPLALFTK
jgi:lysophospholipase L1-like esterase